MGAIGATLGIATNNLYSSPKKVSTLYITWLFNLNWIWRRKFEICKVLALGALPLGPHRNNFESLAPKDDSCHVWLKSNHAFSKRRWNSYFLQRAPSPTCYTHRGLLGPPWELPWTTFILHLTRYLYTLHNLTILLLDLEKKMFEICMVFALLPGRRTTDENGRQ